MKTNPVALRLVGKKPEGVAADSILTPNDLELYLNGEKVHLWQALALNIEMDEPITATIKFVVTDLEIEGVEVPAQGE